MDNDIKKIQSKNQSEFDHYYACWAVNHNGWRKAKRMNHKTALAKIRQNAKKEIMAQSNI